MNEVFQKSWAVLAAAIVVGACIVSNSPPMVAVGTLCGILFVVSVAFQKWYANLFGAALAIIFGVLSYEAGYLANAASNLLYIAPMSLYGLWYWKKNKDAPVNTLSKKAMIGVGTVTAIGCGASVVAAMQAGSNHFILDGISGFLPLVATMLLVLRYKEQWLLWIPYNAIEVVLWISAASLAPEVLAIMVLRIIFLVNSLIGFYVWNKKNV